MLTRGTASWTALRYLCLLGMHHGGWDYPSGGAHGADHAFESIQSRWDFQRIDILRAIYFATDQGARVINMSFSLPQRSQEMIWAINFAASREGICVSSAGNNGARLLVYPAAFDDVFGVASTSNLDARSTFSNFSDLVKFAAPGEGIITTYPDGHYATAWGTSFSAPFLSAGVALLVQIDVRTDESHADNALSHAKRMSDLGRGRIDLYETLLSVVRPKSGS